VGAELVFLEVAEAVVVGVERGVGGVVGVEPVVVLPAVGDAVAVAIDVRRRVGVGVVGAVVDPVPPLVVVAAGSEGRRVRSRCEAKGEREENAEAPSEGRS